MEIKEFGHGNEKIALLIHGGYVSWKTLNTQCGKRISTSHCSSDFLFSARM